MTADQLACNLAGKRVSPSHPPCKSELMLLSERFRDRFANSCGEGEECKIDLNKCALALGVPRRRLYDITIVYEAAEVTISLHAQPIKRQLCRYIGKKCKAWKSAQDLSSVLCSQYVDMLSKGSSWCFVYGRSLHEPGLDPEKPCCSQDL